VTSTKVKRSLIKSFLNTGTILSPTWSLLADGVVAGKINYAPKTTEETYIDQDTASISVDSYAPNLPIEATAKAGDTVYDYIDALRKARGVLADAETEIVNVWLYRTPANGYYLAEKQNVSIQVDDFGGEGGVPAKINYTINFVGDPTLGIFKPAATATFAALPIAAVLATMVIGSVTLTPLFATDPTNLLYVGSVSNATTTVTMTSTCIAGGAVVVQKDTDDTTIAQGDPASLDVGVNHLKIQVTVGSEVVTYYIDITRAAA
jgi:hypothetical protein